MRRGPSIRWLLLGVNVLVLLTPLVSVGVLRQYDTYLMRQTERQLIAQSVVVAEAWREAWLQEGPGPEGTFRPPDRLGEKFVPVEPVIDFGTEVGPPAPEDFRRAPPGDTRARRAGRRVEALLKRAQVFNLSAIRVLDERGCVVATTGEYEGVCLDRLPEVGAALSGNYAASARERVSKNPEPPLGDIRRRGKVYVLTALPVFSDGKVIGVVRASRTGLDALSSLWMNRRGLMLLGLATLAVTIAVSLLFSAAIASPVRAITEYARAVASGRRREPPVMKGWAPSEIRALGRALDTMTGQLTSRAAYVSGFATNVSHELKTPLTAIRGAAELLRENWTGMDHEQRQRFLDNIDQDAGRMERLVTRLLELARIETAVETEPPRVELRGFLQSLAERYGGRVEMEWERDAPESVCIHPDHLASAVGNLLDNAVRHGAGAVVRLVVGRSGERARIRVRDRGPGISPANRKRLFDRFFTTERDRGGTGLGLAIVKAVAESRGGEVDVQTGEDGSTFTVTL